MNVRERPWACPGNLSVERGRDTYLAENGFSVAAYQEASSPVEYLGLRFRVPNPASRRWALPLHDLHHVATGFGTDPCGEAEISAWELRHGLRGLSPYVGAIVVSVALAGLFLAPRRTLRAFRAAKRGRSLFQLQGYRYEQLLALSVAELRQLLGVAPDGLADEPPRLHAAAPQYAG